MTSPRIQFRILKEDDDLRKLFENVDNTTDVAKRMIRLGLEYEKKIKPEIVVYVQNKNKANALSDNIKIVELSH